MFIKSFVISMLAITLVSCGSEHSEPKMIAIKGGSFQMGCVKPIGCGSGEMQSIRVKGGSVQGYYSSYFDCQDNEKPVHTVTIKPFFMSETEVTFTQMADHLRSANRGSTNRDNSSKSKGFRVVKTN